jgi:transposase-like protein
VDIGISKLITLKDLFKEKSISIPLKVSLAFAKERLIKFHGVSKAYFPLYLKEMEFRYNHRDENIFQILAKYICNLVPNLL